MSKKVDKTCVFRIALVVLMAIAIIIAAILNMKIRGGVTYSERKEVKLMVMRECKLIHTNMVGRETIVSYLCPNGVTYEFEKNKRK